jgi:hypothetical protein
MHKYDFKFASDKHQRIREAQQRHSILTSTPLYPNIQRPIRTRSPEKEVSGQFRFAAHNQFERVYDELNTRSTTGKSPQKLVKESLRIEKEEIK